MHRRSRFLWIPFTLGLAIGAGRAEAAGDDRPTTAALLDGKLIHLGGGGRFHAWRLDNGRFDAAMIADLANNKVTHIASADGKLWGAGGATVESWSTVGRSWVYETHFDGGDEDLYAFAVVGKSPLLIFPSKVMDLKAGITFPAPNRRGVPEIDPRDILCSLATGSDVWIGTGRGEWGGALYGLDRQTGRWSRREDSYHFVTGIAQARPDEVIVSWSMDYGSADTLIRVHRRDARPRMSHPEIRSKFYQIISYNPYDKILYGVEDDDLVSIVRGRPKRLVELDGENFENGPRAIGIATGVAALLPFAKGALIVVPNRGMPWRFAGGRLTRLVAP